MYVLFYSSKEKVFCLKVCVSRLERDLGYPSTNPFAGMRSFVTERPGPGLGQKAEQCRSPDETQKTRRWKYHDVPIFLMCTSRS
jgi:hypothetical protein